MTEMTAEKFFYPDGFEIFPGKNSTLLTFKVEKNGSSRKTRARN